MTSEKEVSGRKIWFSYKTTQEHLDSIGLTETDVKENIEYISRLFGLRYIKLFPLSLTSQDIERFIILRNLFEKIETRKGFKKFIRQFDKNNIKHHLFTAKTAAWLLEQGFDVELEPDLTSEKGGKPDILATLKKEKIIVECKDVDISRFFELDKKKEISDIVYEKVQTCDQITLYIKKCLEPSDIHTLLSDKTLISEIYRAGAESDEAHISVNEKLDIGIIRKPPIIGAERDFLEGTLEVILADNKSGVKSPGYAFMRGGRSIGVFGPPPDYSRRWEDKRKQSKKQSIEGYPMLVMVNGDHVLGDPMLHEEFFNRVWLTENNSNCSSIGLLNVTTTEVNIYIMLYEN